MALTLQRRSDLLIKPLGNDGEHVVKDPVTGTYFNLPPQEAFLLNQLDGARSAEAICQSFELKFADPLSVEDLEQFLEMARGQNLLVPIAPKTPDAPVSPAPAAQPRRTPFRFDFMSVVRNVLYWRRNVFDPDRLLNCLAPRLAWLWTASFFWVSLSLIVLAALLQATHWREFADYLPETFRWETVVMAWFILFVVTTLHEFAHGLTCKHHGGEVHEIGFLLMFFMPCFYCNVSDAWLIREKSKRIWVTLAGGYCDLCLWALGVFLWRLTLPGTPPNHLAWLVLTICGGRLLFNFNPLLKLDGYYMASDWLEIPNLRKRSLEYVAAHLRCLLWGAPRPEASNRGRVLLVFGLACWMFTAFYIGLLFYAVYHIILAKVGLAGMGLLVLLGWMVLPNLFGGLFAGEVSKMFKLRWKRKVAWVVGLACVAAALLFYPMEDTVTGSFKTRPTVHAEIRAPVTGFLKTIHSDEGCHVSAGAILAYFEIPDLASKLAQKTAEEKEVQAKLKLLLAGARPEELNEQRHKVERAKAWCILAKQDLERKQAALKEELERLEQQIGFAVAQVEFARNGLERSQKLLEKKALAQDHFLEAQRQFALAQTQLAQANTQKRERVILGTLEAEAELARREKESADAQATLRILEAGSRPEDIDAEKARLARIGEEKDYYEKLGAKVRVTSPVSGVILTPHLKEKIGQYLKEGELICEIEDPQSMEVETLLEEQDVHRIQSGCTATLKPRSLPLLTLSARVKSIAPQAVAGKVQSTVNVYCQLENPSVELITGMTGYARISCGQCSPASYLSGRFLRYLRTEIWW